MKHRVCLSLLLPIISGSSLFGQLKYDFSQFGKETVGFVKQPGKWDGGDYVRLGVVTATSFLFIETIDNRIRESLMNDRPYFKSAPIEFGRIWGEIYSPIVLFSGFAVHSMLTDDIRTRKIAFEIGQATMYAGVIDFALKAAIGRARPYLNEGPTTFRAFSSVFNDDYKSIPSGHNTVAFVLSTVLSRNAGPRWLKALAFAPAALTFVSRVYQDQHWVSDAFAGAALGYFTATWVVDTHERNKSSMKVSSIFPLSITIVF